jgi:hypothetical protein
MCWIHIITIEAHFATAAHRGRRGPLEMLPQGRSAEVVAYRQRHLWSDDSQSLDCHQYKNLMESYLLIANCNLGKTLPYIIVQFQLVFNRFFCFLYEFFQKLLFFTKGSIQE